MVTTRYSDQQGSKSRQNIMRLYYSTYRIRVPDDGTVVSHIQRIGCQPEKNYFTRWNSVSESESCRDTVLLSTVPVFSFPVRGKSVLYFK